MESVSCTFKRGRTELSDSLSVKTIGASRRNVNMRLKGGVSIRSKANHKKSDVRPNVGQGRPGGRREERPEEGERKREKEEKTYITI
ncbi:hypothetical protein AVEN_214542-1 [Araneus ventricosus]|uniref:Uncharacterized protein n=1 Tax=Araneus ventricosus TaxID=182803 RepID=A0A4Y2GGF4_ARAVE|nr:hypothetical protein AVEN_214542-1 [Araneus ventricosus]